MLRSALPVLLLLTGCGPVISTQGMVQARSALIEADQAEAAQAAPYQYLLGSELYDKAWEAFFKSQYQASQSFSQQAHQNLVEAKNIATVSKTPTKNLPSSQPDEAASDQSQNSAADTERWGE